MSKLLRVLIVEDSADDAELLVRELKRGADEVEWLRVESGPAMRSALESREWDLVVADFNLPRFSAPAALELLQETGIDVPLIIVSGSVGEEIAVQSMRAGAHDFLLKGSLKRLMPAVERELGQSKQRRARRQAEERNRRLAAIVESSDDAIISTDLVGNVLSWNRGAERMYGYSAAEMKGRPVSLLEPAERRGEVAAFLESLQAGEDLRRYETIRVRKAGAPVAVAVSLFPIPGHSGGIVGFASIARDITERKKAEEALRTSEARKGAVLEAAFDAIIAIDQDGRILEVNPAAERTFGFEKSEMIGQELAELIVPPALREAHRHGLERQRRTGKAEVLGRVLEMPALRRDGQEFPVQLFISRVDVEGVPHFIGFIRDVTEQRSLEAQLRQSQKMEAVGTLAGGVAHDFNNLLTTILGYSELVLDRLGADSPLREEITEIERAGERAASLTRQLLAFSRKQVLAPVDLDLNGVVADMEKMLRRLIGEDVALAAVLQPDLWTVRADPGQIEQVIVNLVVNARDAMPRGGKITIETRNLDLDDSYVRTHSYARAGEHVCLSVSDTGTGMDAETRSHIFEPFFTTKGPGKGTGLGLSTVYGIVKQSGGSIEVYSEPGRGTSFKIYLPRVAAAEKRPSRVARRPPSGGSETILLVEDEEAVRRLARLVLEKMRYTVLEAASAEDAQSIVMSHVGGIDLLLTDSVMPGMSGPDLAKILRSQRPGLKVLFMSGYTDDAIVRHGLIDPTEAFLQKPFSPEALTRKVREVLVSGPS